MKRNLILYCALMVLLNTREVYPVSFDCSKAAGYVETTICSHDRLSSLDDTLSSLYKTVVKNSPVPEDSRLQQREWIKNGRNTCLEIRCLEQAYESRILELERELKNLPFKPSFLKPVMTIRSLSTDDNSSKIDKKEPVEITGRIRFNHDAAGGRYDIVSAKINLCIRYVWDLSEEQKDLLVKIEDSGKYVVLKGIQITFKDGSTGIDNNSEVQIYQ